MVSFRTRAKQARYVDTLREKIKRISTLGNLVVKSVGNSLGNSLENSYFECSIFVEAEAAVQGYRYVSGDSATLSVNIYDPFLCVCVSGQSCAI